MEKINIKDITTTHISTTRGVKEMLKQIAETEDRKMRKVLERIIKNEYEKVVLNKF